MHGAPIDRSVHGFIVAIQPVIRMSTVADFAEIVRWYDGLSGLPAWQDAVAKKDAARDAFIASLKAG